MMTYSMQPQLSAYSHHYATSQASPYYSRPAQPQHSSSRSQTSVDSHHSVNYPVERRPDMSSHSRSYSSESNGSEQRSKPFLPSISNLLIIADGERERDVAPPKSHFQLQDGFQERSRHQQSPPRSTPLDHRPITDHPAVQPPQGRTATSTSPQLHSLPHHSSSTASSPLAAPAKRSYLSFSALNNSEPPSQPIKQQQQEAQQQPTPSYTTSPATTTSPYAYSPSTASSNSPAPSTRSVAGSGGPFDGPLPADQQALAQAAAMREAAAAAAESQASNPWQHHHYINASSAAGFPSSSQDRYICPKCSKAFSRPSSLKIHSHSHTGEKPFLCPYPGCGKSFSVRSNMRRHERGCHSAGGAGAGSTSPRMGRD